MRIRPVVPAVPRQPRRVAPTRAWLHFSTGLTGSPQDSTLVTAQGTYRLDFASARAAADVARFRPGQWPVRVSGQVVPGRAGAPRSFRITSMRPAGQPFIANGYVEKKGGRFVAGGLTLEPMSPEVAQRLEALAPLGFTYARGLRRGSTLEVWEVFRVTEPSP